MPPQLETLDAIEIVRSIESGMTNPFLCMLEDDQLYAVKGRGALPQGLIAEIVAGSLGRILGLPIPDFVIAKVPKKLIDNFEGDEARVSLGTAPAFGSLWQEPVDNVSTPGLLRHDTRVLATLYAFDHWTLNGDRSLSETGGNANLLEKLIDRSLVVIDHNLAFSATYQPRELAVHACRAAWHKASENYLFETELRYKMAKAETFVEAIIADLPYEWLEDQEPLLERIRAALSRMHGHDFWNEL